MISEKRVHYKKVFLKATALLRLFALLESKFSIDFIQLIRFLVFQQILITLDVPIKKVGAPIKKVGVPTKKVGTPIKKVGVPIKKVGEPIKKVGAPTKKVGVPSQKISAWG